MNSGDCPRHVRSVRQDDRQGRDQAQNAEHANKFWEVRFGLRESRIHGRAKTAVAAAAKKCRRNHVAEDQARGEGKPVLRKNPLVRVDQRSGDNDPCHDNKRA